VRRYGFHGLSYEYIASVLPQLDAKAAAGRTVVLHLGSGASMCALSAGRSVASTRASPSHESRGLCRIPRRPARRWHRRSPSRE